MTPNGAGDESSLSYIDQLYSTTFSILHTIQKSKTNDAPIIWLCERVQGSKKEYTVLPSTALTEAKQAGWQHILYLTDLKPGAAKAGQRFRVAVERAILHMEYTEPRAIHYGRGDTDAKESHEYEFVDIPSQFMTPYL